MLSFSEFMTESGDSSNSFMYTGKRQVNGETHKHSYTFHSDGEKYDAFMIHHRHDPTDVHTIFQGTHSIFDTSKSQGHKAIKVFATVKNIMAYHAKHHPEIKHFSFTSDKSDLSRGSLYARGTKKLGGTNDTRDLFDNHHTIPAHALGEPKKNPINHVEV